MTHTDAEEALKGTSAAEKNEILYSKFSINYNNEADMFKKGSVIYRNVRLEEEIPSLGTCADWSW